jgi:hypothetical protein
MSSTARRSPPTPALSSRAGTPAPLTEPVKMRTSCHSCAFSKLKCSGDKPICARCAKRGLPCEYVAAKRGGRKPNQRPSAADQHVFEVLKQQDAPRVPPQAVMYTKTPSQQPSGNNAPLSPTPSAARPEGSLSPFAFHNMPSGMLSCFDPGFSSSSTLTDSDLSDYFPFPEDLDMLAADLLPTDFDTNTGSYDFDALMNPIYPIEDNTCDLFADFVQATGQDIQHAPNHDFRNQQQPRSQKPQHSCLLRALELLKQHSPSSCQEMSSKVPTLTAVIAQNGATIEAVGAMLECSCSKDGYQLVVMSLIVFKVLSWYAAAARKEANNHNSSHQTTPLNKVGDEDAMRTAAQLVLIESHRVRRLIEQASTKLKAKAEAEEPENENALPFSPAMYNQLDSALMTQLRSLSLDMIDRLKSY